MQKDVNLKVSSNKPEMLTEQEDQLSEWMQVSE